MPRSQTKLSAPFFAFARRITSPRIDPRADVSLCLEPARVRQDERLIERLSEALEPAPSLELLAANDPPTAD